MEIRYTKLAVKSIGQMDRKTKQRIKHAIEKIPEGDIAALKGKGSELRLRVGKYRVIFEYRQVENLKIVYIINVGSRGEIYK